MRESAGAGRNVNGWLVRHGHLLPLAALCFCIVVATTVNVVREIRYESAARDENASEDTPSRAGTTTTTTTPSASVREVAGQPAPSMNPGDSFSPVVRAAFV
ncbi:uncharacterized protein Tco025E_06703 [Trypanosoma conorhini]|uniref:Uncharacterized protein n=1 Tax=Trypanosoma conorhini TaxID=83891 RepID=A0A422P018_9TRYP|nr:uncharacterized protein Tco025E_06703 [Trypanosoma conorhini]RNF11093.1 hypothetical protein Tco025E_06703 [Trypanosoma conorhini]